MLLNKQIRELLKKNRGDMAQFARFLGTKWDCLNYQLKSDKLKHNLHGVYKEFLINEKEKNVK